MNVTVRPDAAPDRAALHALLHDCRDAEARPVPGSEAEHSDVPGAVHGTMRADAPAALAV